MILHEFEMNREDLSITFIVICHKNTNNIPFLYYFKNQCIFKSICSSFINEKWDTSPLWSSQWPGQRSRLDTFWTMSYVLRLLNWCDEDFNRLFSEKISTWLIHSNDVVLIIIYLQLIWDPMNLKLRFPIIKCTMDNRFFPIMHCVMNPL